MKNDNYIYDRYGERIRIFVSDGKDEKEIDNKCLNEIMSLHNISLKRNIFKFVKLSYNYLVNKNKMFMSHTYFGIELRKAYIKSKLKLEPKILKINYRKRDICLVHDKLFNYLDFYSIIRDIFLYDQYNMKNNIKGSVVFDVGANVGVSSIYAVLNGAKKIYAFEPVPETYDILKNNIKLNKLENKIVPINYGLGNDERMKEVRYSFAGDGMAKINLIEDEVNKKVKNTLIRIIKIDKFVKKYKIRRVNFIKMDVEGYEENVLLGAKETIKKWKPILSFSAYHLPTDKERLPNVVKSIRPDYNIELNKYGEEDFYCY